MSLTILSHQISATPGSLVVCLAPEHYNINNTKSVPSAHVIQGCLRVDAITFEDREELCAVDYQVFAGELENDGYSRCLFIPKSVDVEHVIRQMLEGFNLDAFTSNPKTLPNLQKEFRRCWLQGVPSMPVLLKTSESEEELSANIYCAFVK
jgi:hypothetical protein